MLKTEFALSLQLWVGGRGGGPHRYHANVSGSNTVMFHRNDFLSDPILSIIQADISNTDPILILKYLRVCVYVCKITGTNR